MRNVRRRKWPAAALLLLTLTQLARAGHLTEIRGERAVVYGGRTWTWEQIQARRAIGPARFDANHPTLGWALRDADAAVARRDLDPARFDRYHPYLGWLLAGLPRPVVPVPPPGPPPGPCPPSPPIHAVPEPPALANVLIATALGTAWIWVAILVRWLTARPREGGER